LVAVYYTVKGIPQNKAITRQVFGPLPICVFSAQNDLVAAANYQDLWWAAPASSESGWGVNFRNNATFAYTVDSVSQTKAITRQVFRTPGSVCL
jgi:hypothetical protein